MHPLVEHYKENKEAYHESFFAGWVLRTGDLQIKNWRKTKAAKEL